MMHESQKRHNRPQVSPGSLKFLRVSPEIARFGYGLGESGWFTGFMNSQPTPVGMCVMSGTQIEFGRSISMNNSLQNG